MAETLQEAAVKYLLDIPEVVAAVGKFPASEIPFIFQDEMLVNLEELGSAVSAVVVEDGGPINLTMTRFRSRRLAVTIWANGVRDGMGNLTNPKLVDSLINDTFMVIDRHLHRTDPGEVMWSTIITHGSDRIGDLGKPVPIIDGDGIKAATAYYSVII